MPSFFLGLSGFPRKVNQKGTRWSRVVAQGVRRGLHRAAAEGAGERTRRGMKPKESPSNAWMRGRFANRPFPPPARLEEEEY